MTKSLAWRTLAVVLLALTAAGASTPAPVAAQAKPIVWNLPHISAPTYYHTINYTAFGNKVKEKSGGRMEIRFHAASSLYPGPELLPSRCSTAAPRSARSWPPTSPTCCWRWARSSCRS